MCGKCVIHHGFGAVAVVVVYFRPFFNLIMQYALRVFHIFRTINDGLVVLVVVVVVTVVVVVSSILLLMPMV